MHIDLILHPSFDFDASDWPRDRVYDAPQNMAIPVVEQGLVQQEPI